MKSIHLKPAMPETKEEKDYILTLEKDENHRNPRKLHADVCKPKDQFLRLPKLPPKKKYIVTMDRSEMNPKDVPLMYVPAFHRVNVDNQPEVRYPVMSSYKESFREEPAKKPEWRTTYKTTSHSSKDIASTYKSPRAKDLKPKESGYPSWSKQFKYGPPQMALEEMGDVSYPYLTSHPKHGSKQFVLEEKPVTEIYGTDKPSIDAIREQEQMVLGNFNYYQPVQRPDWKFSYHGGDDFIDRSLDASWQGQYFEIDYDKYFECHPNNPRMDIRGRLTIDGDMPYAPTKKEVRFAQNAFNQKHVYVQDRSGQYIERTFNPRTQKQSQKLRKSGKYVDKSFTPHYHDQHPHPLGKDKGYYQKLEFDPDEEYNTRYLPPIKRNGKYAEVSAKVNSFANAHYMPSGGNKKYPTYEIDWQSGPKVETFFPDLKSKSYPNTVMSGDDEESGDYETPKQEVQSQIEIGSIADTCRSQTQTARIDNESVSSVDLPETMHSAGNTTASSKIKPTLTSRSISKSTRISNAETRSRGQKSLANKTIGPRSNVTSNLRTSSKVSKGISNPSRYSYTEDSADNVRDSASNGENTRRLVIVN